MQIPREGLQTMGPGVLNLRFGVNLKPEKVGTSPRNGLF